jgi:hypothetical protein
LVNEEGGEPTLALDSYKELRYIFNWSIANRNYRPGDIVLIGGWAVHSFNPWKYSLDIDLIATDRFKKSLQSHLYSTRKYSRERNGAGNTLFLKSLDTGNIYLDFLPKKDKFHGTGITLNLLKIDYGTTTKNISYSFGAEFQVIVPEISMLFLLKLKAAWDRYYELSHATVQDKDHLNDKFTKDCGDIVALLQSDEFQFARFDWLSTLISEFDFLEGFLKQGIIEANSTFDHVSRNERKALVRKLLSLI